MSEGHLQIKSAPPFHQNKSSLRTQTFRKTAFHVSLFVINLTDNTAEIDWNDYL